MPKFPTFGLTPIEEKIKRKLVTIGNYSAPRWQFDLLLRTIAEISTDRKNEAQSVIFEVARQIKGQGPLLIADSSTHGRRVQQVEILRRGLLSLDQIQPGVRKTRDEEAAIRQDAQEFVKNVERQQIMNSVQPVDTVVFKMSDPGIPIPIPGFKTCRQVRLFLQSNELADHPDLWAKREKAQHHTPQGLSWDWIHPNCDVRGKYLEFVERPHPGTYIVVLKLIKNQNQNLNPAEIPEPLNIEPVGNPCCALRCPNVNAHLKAIWPNHRIARALRMEDGTDVLSDTFDDNLFAPYSNDLCVHLE